jgi:predicted RNA-binding Zn ribbon-like protein
MILIQSPDGSEKCLVKSMHGYDGWTVIADPAEPPAPYHYWDEKADVWRLDETAQTRGELIASVSNPESLADIIADILARLPASQ